MNTKVFHFNFEIFNRKKTTSHLIPYNFLGAFEINVISDYPLTGMNHRIFKNIICLSTLKKYCSASTLNKILKLINKNKNDYFVFESLNFVSHPHLNDVFILHN